MKLESGEVWITRELYRLPYQHGCAEVENAPSCGRRAHWCPEKQAGGTLPVHPKRRRENGTCRFRRKSLTQSPPTRNVRTSSVCRLEIAGKGSPQPMASALISSSARTTGGPWTLARTGETGRNSSTPPAYPRACPRCPAHCRHCAAADGSGRAGRHGNDGLVAVLDAQALSACPGRNEEACGCESVRRSLGPTGPSCSCSRRCRRGGLRCAARRAG